MSSAKHKAFRETLQTVKKAPQYVELIFILQLRLQTTGTGAQLPFLLRL